MEKINRCSRGHMIPPCKACLAIENYVEGIQVHIRELKAKGLSQRSAARIIGIGKTAAWRLWNRDEAKV